MAATGWFNKSDNNYILRRSWPWEGHSRLDQCFGMKNPIRRAVYAEVSFLTQQKTLLIY